MNAIVSLIKEAPDRSLPLLPCEGKMVPAMTQKEGPPKNGVMPVP